MRSAIDVAPRGRARACRPSCRAGGRPRGGRPGRSRRRRRRTARRTAARARRRTAVQRPVQQPRAAPAGAAQPVGVRDELDLVAHLSPPTDGSHPFHPGPVRAARAGTAHLTGQTRVERGAGRRDARRSPFNAAVSAAAPSSLVRPCRRTAAARATARAAARARAGSWWRCRSGSACRGTSGRTRPRSASARRRRSAAAQPDAAGVCQARISAVPSQYAVEAAVCPDGKLEVGGEASRCGTGGRCRSIRSRRDQEDQRLAGDRDGQDHRLAPAVEHHPEHDHGDRGEPDDRRRLAEQRADVGERLAGRRPLLLQPLVQPGVGVGERRCSPGPS